MSYNNAYKKLKNYLGNMLRRLLQRHPEVPTWMHFWSCWDPQLQSQNWSSNLMPTGQWKHCFDTSTTSEPKNIPLKGGDPLNDTTMLKSFNAVCMFYCGGLKLGADLLLFGFSLCLPDERTISTNTWAQTVGLGANLKPHKLLSTKHEVTNHFPMLKTH